MKFFADAFKFALIENRDLQEDVFKEMQGMKINTVVVHAVSSPLNFCYCDVCKDLVFSKYYAFPLTHDCPKIIRSLLEEERQYTTFKISSIISSRFLLDKEFMSIEAHVFPSGVMDLLLTTTSDDGLILFCDDTLNDELPV